MTTYTKTDPLLTLENVSLKFGDFQCLRDINLQIKDIVVTEGVKGQVVTLLGKSGAGKSTLFRLIAGLLKPTTGTVKVGKEQYLVKPGDVGMVLQTYPLFRRRTLLSNLRLVSSDKDRINQYMQDFDIYQHRNKYPSQLSGGQRQRTAIVQQLLCSEHFVLLDEPLSGLDPVAIDKLLGFINKLVEMDETNTVIISTHILEPALAISDYVYMLGNTYTRDILNQDGTPSIYPDGATIVYEEDLAAQGLAWNPGIRGDVAFHQLVEDIRNKFKTI